MESTTAYIISIVMALLFLLLSAFIAMSIKFEGGSNPKDPKKRKMWFWVLAVISPAITFLLGYFVFKPDANVLIVNNYVTALSIGIFIGIALYIISGLILSKMFRNGKLGNWF